MSTLREAWTRRLYSTLIPAVPVPFKADGSIDWPSQERYVEHMKAQAVEGVAVWAHTGRGLYLGREEREDVLVSWREGMGPDVLTVVGVGARVQSTSDRDFLNSAVDMARDAVEGGADLLMPYAPIRFRNHYEHEKKIEEYYREIADIGHPMILFYLYEQAGGITYPMSFLSRLLELESIVGIKVATLDSVVTFQDIAALLRESCPDVTLVTGEDRFFPYSFAAGAKAALVGLAAACTTLHLEMTGAWFSEQYGQFHQQALRVDEFARAVFTEPMEGYIQRMLHILAAQEILHPDGCHDPFGPPLDDEDLGRVDSMLKNLGLV